MQPNRFFYVIAGISGAIAVGLGAYGSHVLRFHADENLQRSFDIASKYHFYHTIALVAIAGRITNKTGIMAAVLITAGLLLFCGGIYMSVLVGIHSFTKVTPVGGMSFMAGWLLFAIAALMDRK